jgi:hypothetical protein
MSANKTAFDDSPGPAGSSARIEENGLHPKPEEAAGSTRNRPSPPAASVNVVDRKAFDRILAELRREYKPAGATAELFVERVALGWFRLERAKALEEELVPEKSRAPILPSRSDQLHETLLVALFAGALPKELPLTEEAVRAAILRTPELLELAETKPADPNPHPLLPDLKELVQFQRYEAGLEARFFKAVRELDRLQERRHWKEGKV